MKNFIALVLFFFSFNSFAESMKIKTPAIQKVIHSNGVVLSEIQAKIRCHFRNNKTGVNKISRKYIYGQMTALDTDASELQRYRFVSKRGNYFDMLPGFEVISCAYVLITIGKEKSTGSNLMGDIVLFGEMNQRMSKEELNMLKDKKYVALYLNKRLEEMVLVSGRDNRGRKRIINLYD